MRREIVINLMIGSIIVIILVLIFSLIAIDQMDAVTQVQCCEGKACSDTYYTSIDNQCHLTLCENSAFTNKEDCTYDGANKTMEWIN